MAFFTLMNQEMRWSAIKVYSDVELIYFTLGNLTLDFSIFNNFFAEKYTSFSHILMTYCAAPPKK